MLHNVNTEGYKKVDLMKDDVVTGAQKEIKLTLQYMMHYG